MNFVEAVNRVLRSNGRLGADDDDVTFNDTAHRATITLARIAIQDEVNDLAADNLIPYEVVTGSIATVSSTPTYPLPLDFVRFYGEPAKIYYPTGNRNLYEYPGGLNALSQTFTRYNVELGEPHYWYLSPTSTKRLGLWQVPNGARTYTFLYEKTVSVEESSDTLPFQNEPEAQAFCQAAGRRFKALSEENPDVERFILKDPTYSTAKARLLRLMKGRNAHTRYAAVYR